ncbi:DMT family transporter [Paenibacillus cremeus]|uniref:DMT family transporter n=1 Tax=Paenibacillus cremeus TaxID=2163881 RepID=A0A559KAL7_9BACL|nr:DMT family transporter [Paenibacillus cremeus]TVY09180.1 DMT family transporter [Paenibacillus cremeus]
MRSICKLLLGVRQLGEFLALLALVLFSVNVIVTKAASGRVHLDVGFVISIFVNVVFSGLLLIIRLLTSSQPVGFHGFGLLMFMVSGLLSSYLGRSLYFDSIAKLGPSKASTYMVSSPLFTFVISWLFLREMLSWQELIAIVVVLTGLFLVSYSPKRNDQRQASWKNLIQPGAWFALLGALSYALGNITRGAGIRDWNEPILGGFFGALTGLLLHLLLNKQARTVVSSLRTADRRGVWLYALSGGLTISAQIGHIAAMHYIPISIATLITTAQPLLVIPLSYFLLKNQEALQLRTILGSALVLLGIGALLLVS